MTDQIIRLPHPEEIKEGKQVSQRKLSQLAGSFASPDAYARALTSGDPVVYSVTSYEQETGDGQLHYGYGILQPGKVGDEYYFTRGHLHALREVAEVYICLRGRGLLLMEDETSGKSWAVELAPDGAVYVPGHTAHRTINTGDEPLVYWGVYPSNAGHDYQSIQERNFAKVVVCVDQRPVVLDRTEYLKKLAERKP